VTVVDARLIVVSLTGSIDLSQVFLSIMRETLLGFVKSETRLALARA